MSLKHLPLNLLLLLFSFTAFSQSVSKDYAVALSEDSIRSYLMVLTADSLEGRETGYPGQKKSAAFLASKYSGWNIPVQFQKHSLSVRANTGKNLAIEGKYFVFYKDFYYVNHPKDSFLILNDFLIAGFGISNQSYDDFDDNSVKGKNLIVRWKKPEWKKIKVNDTLRNFQKQSLQTYIKSITEKNPASVFIVVDSIPGVIYQIENDPALSDELSRIQIPVLFVNENTAEAFLPHKNKKLYSAYIKTLEKKSKPKNIHRKAECSVKILSDTKILVGENVLAILEGKSKKDEYIVISSHYDHLGIKDSLINYGADDNASGTSAVLEMARIFQDAKSKGNGPERSILFLNVSGEEKGLLGSSFYVKHPIVPLSKIVANLNIDMIGRTDEKHDSMNVKDYIYLIGADRLSKELAHINFNANSEFTKLELDSAFDNDSDPNKYYQRSDHYNFAKNNIPVIFYFNGTHTDYHKPSDTPDKIDFTLLRKRAQLVFLTAWELLNRRDRIKLNKQ